VEEFQPAPTAVVLDPAVVDDDGERTLTRENWYKLFLIVYFSFLIIFLVLKINFPIYY
jgi:hypothetical protein